MTRVRPPTARPTSTAHRAAPALVSEAYRSQAGDYDQRTDAFRHWRELLVQRLPARRGDTVLDVGCGTGLCLPLLQHKVGRTGAIIGIDASEHEHGEQALISKASRQPGGVQRSTLTEPGDDQSEQPTDGPSRRHPPPPTPSRPRPRPGQLRR